MGVIIKNSIVYGGDSNGDAALPPLTLTNLIASPYSNLKTYVVNEFCIYEGYLYRCKTPITTAENFTPAKWETANISEYVTEWLNLPEVSEVSY